VAWEPQQKEGKGYQRPGKPQRGVDRDRGEKKTTNEVHVRERSIHKKSGGGPPSSWTKLNKGRYFGKNKKEKGPLGELNHWAMPPEGGIWLVNGGRTAPIWTKSGATEVGEGVVEEGFW